MKEIYKGKEMRIVTNGAFKSIYEPNGWKEIESASEMQREANIGQDADLDIEALLLKPINEMIVVELKAVAKHLGLEVGSKNKEELINMLIEAMGHE